MAGAAISETDRRSNGLLDRETTIATARFNRWLVPPAALAIHLCIGMAYGFSVFWLPMSKLLPAAGATCAAQSFLAELTSSSCNWSVADVTHIFETFIAMLGISAAIWGGWLERAGPRKAGFIAALCWGGGLIVGGYGVSIHQLWLVYLGCGFIGGIGQGLGYITPVSTLIKWFPDRRGMATGFAIMGYGGGAMIGSPLAVWLMARFSHGGVPGVATTLMVMGALYFVVMALGAFGFRVAPVGWRPAGWTPPAAATGASMITARHVHLNRAWKTPQFWLIWGVLCLNVTAGISVISMASPMLQEVFGGRLLGLDLNATLTVAQKAAIVAAAAGLVGLISLFQQPGPHLLGIDVGLSGPQEHLLRLLRGRHCALLPAADLGPSGIGGAVCGVGLHHPDLLWRRLRHAAGLSRRHLRHSDGRRDPRQAADRLVPSPASSGRR